MSRSSRRVGARGTSRIADQLRFARRRVSPMLGDRVEIGMIASLGCFGDFFGYCRYSSNFLRQPAPFFS
jgi:hypothetical protein